MKRFFAVSLLVLIVGASIAFSMKGGYGLAGMLAAYAVGGYGAWVLALLCFAFGRFMKQEKQPLWALIFLPIAAIVKFPLVAGVAVYLKRLSYDAIHAFEFGIVLVYFVLVGWAYTHLTLDS